MTKFVRTLALLAAVALPVHAQRLPGYNYEESKIPPYTLLDPLTLANGQPVSTVQQWETQRRPQLLHLFEEDIFGRTPDAARHAVIHAKIVEHNEHALDGLAIREQIDLTFDPPPGFTPPTTAQRVLHLLLYVPATHRIAPVILGLNFVGNQGVINDPGIHLNPVWKKPKGATEAQQVTPDESTRGAVTDRWQVKLLLQRGYAVATAYYGDLEPDFKNSAQLSTRELFSTPDQLRQPNAWGAIGLWAWGLSRCLDYLELDPLVDAHRVAVFGHSRLGKTADWAAAQDLRFAAVLSNESGHGGQSIQRRALGETVAHLENSFPYWFAPAYAQWVGHDATIPADGNLLLSLIAPRPLYVGSAEGDEWSDPHGEFIAAVSASRVYRLLGAPALAPDTPRPGIDQPVGLNGNVAYHERSGKHNVTEFDWQHYADFLDNHWGKPADRPLMTPTGFTPPPPCASPATYSSKGVWTCDHPAKQPATTAQVNTWRREARRALFIPDPLPKPEMETYSTAEITPGVTLEKISYVTGYGLRVPANIFRPTHAPAAKLPAIVVVDGHGADKSSWYSYYTGILYAKAGAVVLTYDPIGEGERNDDHKDFTGEHDQLIPSPASMPERLGGLMITDAMQAVSTLSARPDVDPHRIAMMGFSMGSFITSLTSALDPRIHATLLVGGGDLDGPNGYWDQGHAIMCQAGPYKALQFLGDRGAVLFTLIARHADTFIINGTADTVVAIPTHGPDFFAGLKQRVISLNGAKSGSKNRVFNTYFDPGASHRPSWMTPRAAAWLNDELAFPSWRGKDISTLPTIKIANWAAQTHARMTKNYDREDRDFGIIALAANVPALTAEQLDVLQQPKWQQHKAEFIYSSWIDRASKAAAQ